LFFGDYRVFFRFCAAPISSGAAFINADPHIAKWELWDAGGRE